MHLRPSPHMHVSFLPVHTGEERGFWQTTKRGEGSLLSSPLLFPPRLWLQYPARRPPVRPRLPSGQFAWLPPSWERKGNKGGGRRLNTDSPAPMQRRQAVSLLPSPPRFHLVLYSFFPSGIFLATAPPPKPLSRKWLLRESGFFSAGAVQHRLPKENLFRSLLPLLRSSPPEFSRAFPPVLSSNGGRKWSESARKKRYMNRCCTERKRRRKSLPFTFPSTLFSSLVRFPPPGLPSPCQPQLIFHTDVVATSSFSWGPTSFCCCRQRGSNGRTVGGRTEAGTEVR